MSSRAENYLNKAEEKHNKIVNYREILHILELEEKENRISYRIASVDRVLDFIRREYRCGRVCDLETLLCHCQNKLNGNIDGTELSLDESYKGVPFNKEREPIE